MRQIYTVNAVQIVVSAAHPEGVFSVLPGYPKRFDSRNYNATPENPDGDAGRAYEVAKSDYLAVLSTFYASKSRAVGACSMEDAYCRKLFRGSVGLIPNMTPTPEPEPEPEPDPEPEEL